jgi:hypothetical protein
MRPKRVDRKAGGLGACPERFSGQGPGTEQENRNANEEISAGAAGLGAVDVLLVAFLPDFNQLRKGGKTRREWPGADVGLIAEDVDAKIYRPGGQEKEGEPGEENGEMAGGEGHGRADCGMIFDSMKVDTLGFRPIA